MRAWRTLTLRERARQQAEAMAGAFHRRLGAGSPAALAGCPLLARVFGALVAPRDPPLLVALAACSAPAGPPVALVLRPGEGGRACGGPRDALVKMELMPPPAAASASETAAVCHAASEAAVVTRWTVVSASLYLRLATVSVCDSLTGSRATGFSLRGWPAACSGLAGPSGRAVAAVCCLLARGLLLVVPLGGGAAAAVPTGLEPSERPASAAWLDADRVCLYSAGEARVVDLRSRSLVWTLCGQRESCEVSLGSAPSPPCLVCAGEGLVAAFLRRRGAVAELAVSEDGSLALASRFSSRAVARCTRGLRGRVSACGACASLFCCLVDTGLRVVSLCALSGETRCEYPITDESVAAVSVMAAASSSLEGHLTLAL
eukprot:m51a1_g14823 hypothetical protein (375) ;mRNA; f:645961-647526